jgi:hypothetical protein
MGNWQHTYGVRYRLDRLTQKGSANVDDLPDAFIANNDLSKSRFYWAMKFLELTAINV